MSRVRLAESFSALTYCNDPSPSNVSTFMPKSPMALPGLEEVPIWTWHKFIAVSYQLHPWTPRFFHHLFHCPWLKSSKCTWLCLPLSLFYPRHPSQISFSIFLTNSNLPIRSQLTSPNPALLCSCSLTHTPPTVERNSLQNHLTQQLVQCCPPTPTPLPHPPP